MPSRGPALATIAMMSVLGMIADPPAAGAQSYPTRGVRIIVPFSAGGAPDVIGRVIAQGLAEQTGQSFVVENRPGADGVLGAHAVAQAAPDGYTLLITSSSFVINPSFHKNLPFNVVRTSSR
jgi:tripartite-type tricarboxylate transporter receptor subunit TctC